MYSRLVRCPVTMRVASVALVALCTTSIIASPGSRSIQQETAQQHIEKSREAFEKKKYAEAREEVKRALSIDRSNATAYLLLGMIDWRQNKNGDAFKNVKEALKYKPDYADAHFMLGLLHLQRGNASAAKEEAEVAISEDFRTAKVFILLAHADLAINKPEEALTAYEKALGLTSQNDDYAATLKEQIEALRGWLGSKADRQDPSYVGAKLLNNPMPRYTDEARNAGIQGSVHLVILVNEEGKVVSTIILRRLGFGLDDEAAKAARELKFLPATKNGKSVHSWQKVEIEFKLGSRSFELMRYSFI